MAQVQEMAKVKGKDVGRLLKLLSSRREMKRLRDEYEEQCQELSGAIQAELERLKVKVGDGVEVGIPGEELNWRVRMEVRVTEKLDAKRLIEKGVSAKVIEYATVKTEGKPFVTIREVKGE